MQEYAQFKTRFDQSRSVGAIFWLLILLSTVVACVGMTLAWHYPLSGLAAAVAFLVASAAFFTWPVAWICVLPALLPVVGFAPWTGWITFEELDMLVLAVATGGYLRIAWNLARAPSAAPAKRRGNGIVVLAWLLAALFSVSIGIALWRGLADAGGFKFGWFQGYHEPMNSVRLAKGFFLALLVLPLWQHASAQNDGRSAQLLRWGLMAGLAAAALTTVWERLAFTDLLNFSSDYRTTGMFWEMHVGGAALDGFLALALPFALLGIVRARRPAHFGSAALVLALAAYACLTTFSRGVYLAVPVGIAVFAVLYGLQIRQRQRVGASPNLTQARLGTALLLVAGFCMLAAWMFQSSGYRGAGALLAAIALLLPLAALLRSMNTSEWLGGTVAGVLFIPILAVVDLLAPKGAYLAFGIAFTFCATMVWAQRSTVISARVAAPLAFGGFLGTVSGLVLVANHWGETRAVLPAVVSAVACVAAAVWAGLARRPAWPDGIRWQAGVLFVMGVVLATIAVFTGGAYMGERFSTGSRDLDGRLVHWKQGTNMLTTPADWWLGKGLGRFPANHFLVGDPQSHPGDYRLQREADNDFLRLTGGLHTNGWGELFRVTQRVVDPGPTAMVQARVRTATDVALHFEICEKHLLYNAGCLIGNIGVKAAPRQWQTVDLVLKGQGVTRGAWYAPTLLAFSIAMDTRGAAADLDNVQLLGSAGQNLLANGDFANETAHWFFSSDKFHLPWHMKNIFLHVLFDQGIVGLFLWTALVAVALVRLTVGAAKTHPIAPALAASLCSFLTVGMFDSLLDAPRLAVAFYFLTLVGVTMAAAPSNRRHSHRSGSTARRIGPGTRSSPDLRATY